MKISECVAPLGLRVEMFLRDNPDEVFTEAEVKERMRLNGRDKSNLAHYLNNLCSRVNVPHSRMVYGSKESIANLKKKWGLK